MIIKSEPVGNLSDANHTAMDALTEQEVQGVKTRIWSKEPTASELLALGDAKEIVAEGDSWFDYLPGLDILDHLKDAGYKVHKVAEAGDTLENMVYGSEFRWNFSVKPDPLDLTIKLMKEKSGILLFSGGGNDFTEAYLESLLNHRDMGSDIVRSAHADYMFNTVIPNTYEYLIKTIKDRVGARAQIITHGYGRPIPDGRSVVTLFNSFRFGGPWLRPAFLKKNYVDQVRNKQVIGGLLDRFNEVLEKIANNHPTTFHFIDLRPMIQDSWWVNELHLSNSGFYEVSRKFHNVIGQLER